MTALEERTDLARKLAAYRPSLTTIELVTHTPLLLLTGISGAGKNSIKNALMQSGKYTYIISYTTREPRANDGVPERDGADYHFVGFDEVERMLDEKIFVEAKQYGGNVYGTTADEVVRARDSGKTIIADIEVQGVEEYLKIDPNMVAVFVLPPDYAVWQQRILRRYGGRIIEADFKQRMRTAYNELRYAANAPHFHFLVNDSLPEAVAAVERIARGDTIDAYVTPAARHLIRALCEGLERDGYVS